MSNKPIIAVTMGDPAGIGPEIILKALADPVIKRVSRPLILGDWGVLQRARRGKKNVAKLICWPCSITPALTLYVLCRL